MAKTIAARPATQPVRAVALCDDDGAEARRLAGIDLRKKTVASTMIYAGTGVRASQRVTTTGAKKPAAKKATARKAVAKKTAKKAAAGDKPTRTRATKPPIAKKTTKREAVRFEAAAKSITASDTAVRRKRTRTQSQLIGRLVDTIDGQLDQIDAIMRDPERGASGPTDAERYARTVAALARVTVELRKELEAGRRRRADDDSAAGHDQSADSAHLGDPDRPRDLDELRERLSRRLDERLRG